MIKDRKLKKIIFFTGFSVLVICGVITPSVPLRYAEALLLILFVVAATQWWEKSMQLKLLNKEYRKRNRFLDDIFKHSPDMIFYKDLNSKYLGCNDAFAKQYNITMPELIGKTDFDLTPESAKEMRNHDIEVIKTKKISTYEQVVIINPACFKIFHVIKSPLFDNDGNITGVLVIARDITEIKEVEQQKETFVATLTHDLNIPTTAQIRALELLLHGGFGNIEPQQKEILKHVYNSCKYMSNMISTVLSTYKYENGQKNLLLSEFNFVGLVEETCKELQYLAEEKEVFIEANYSEKPLLINGDHLELKRVVTNILSNAISYSLKNSKVIIKAFLVKNKLKFTIENSSNYISKEDLEMLFTKFFTGYTKFRQVGTGLGLYLSKQIITAHNGSMIVESNKEKGNLFGFELDTCIVPSLVH